MSSLEAFSPQGMLHSGWSALVDDYAMTCGWTRSSHALLVADACGGLYCYDGSTGAIHWKRAQIHRGGFLAMAIHPETNLFATAGQDGHLNFWTSERDEVLKSLELGKGWAEHLHWSPDGNFIAVSLSRHVYVFDTNGQEYWRSPAHTSTVGAIAWPSSTELATASYGQVTFFDIVHNTINQKLQWQGSFVSMVLSPDGDVVACGSQVITNFLEYQKTVSN